MKKTFLVIILSLAFVFGMFSSEKAKAAEQKGCETEPATGRIVCKLDNPLQRCTVDSSGTEICKDTIETTDIISTVIKTALGIVGALTLLMLVWGGFQWLTSAGNPEKVKSGMQTMLWAIIGVALVFSSYILLSTFTNYLTGTT